MSARQISTNKTVQQPKLHQSRLPTIQLQALPLGVYHCALPMLLTMSPTSVEAGRLMFTGQVILRPLMSTIPLLTTSYLMTIAPAWMSR